MASSCVRVDCFPGIRPVSTSTMPGHCEVRSNTHYPRCLWENPVILLAHLAPSVSSSRSGSSCDSPISQLVHTIRRSLHHPHLDFQSLRRAKSLYRSRCNVTDVLPPRGNRFSSTTIIGLGDFDCGDPNLYAENRNALNYWFNADHAKAVLTIYSARSARSCWRRSSS